MAMGVGGVFGNQERTISIYLSKLLQAGFNSSSGNLDFWRCSSITHAHFLPPARAPWSPQAHKLIHSTLGYLRGHLFTGTVTIPYLVRMYRTYSSYLCRGGGEGGTRRVRLMLAKYCPDYHCSWERARIEAELMGFSQLKYCAASLIRISQR